MLSFQHHRDRSTRLCDGIQRRQWLQVGSLGALGLSLPDLLASDLSNRRAGNSNVLLPPSAAGLDGVSFGRAKNVIYLWLQGGPPQHETFDPRPDAPLEIRGPFRPIQTNVPGIQFSELLPRTAKRADRLAVIRSLCTDDNNHDVSGYWVLTGYPYGPGSARQIKPTDWPYFGSIVRMLRPSEQLPALSSVWLPDMMRLNDNVTPAGQTGGFLGSMWDPERFVGDPAAAKYRIEGLSLPVELSPDRMNARSGLLQVLDERYRRLEQKHDTGNWDQLSGLAMNLVTSGRAKEAFDLSGESPELRDRYGRHTWGQSCLLARRLVEAGVRLVHVNWPREPGDNAVGNPLWDTHEQNADRLQDVLCPLFDATFSALLDDLGDRGLLEETLVVAIGEFGRTPKINKDGGRDHWGAVFSCALAGAGVSGGQVFGASDRNGAYPAADPIRPHDLTATIFHLLGIRHDSTFPDRTGRPQAITKGEPLYRILGDHPATTERCLSTADESFVPAYDTTLLQDTDFQAARYFSVDAVSRQKGWRAFPLPEPELAERDSANSRSTGLYLLVDRQGDRFPVAGIRGPGVTQPSVTIPAGEKLLLAQEIKNARGGHYSFELTARTIASSPDFFRRCFEDHLTCQMILFRYANTRKIPTEVTVLGSETVLPEFAESAKEIRLKIDRFLGSSVPGVNFSLGNGLGVAFSIEVRKAFEVANSEFAALQLTQVNLQFSATKRNDDVTV